MNIKISEKWLQYKFNCNIDTILNLCHGRCCEGSNRILVSLLPEEEIYFKSLGYNIENHLLMPINKKCPFKLDSGLCKLHETTDKPFGCIASPFTLNKNNTLIVRYRYSRLCCAGSGQPAYKTFYPSLELLFGNVAKEIEKDLDNKELKSFYHMNDKIYNKVKYLDTLK